MSATQRKEKSVAAVRPYVSTTFTIFITDPAIINRERTDATRPVSAKRRILEGSQYFTGNCSFTVINTNGQPFCGLIQGRRDRILFFLFIPLCITSLSNYVTESHRVRFLHAFLFR
jgi:hypothetical protein